MAKTYNRAENLGVVDPGDKRTMTIKSITGKKGEKIMTDSPLCQDRPLPHQEKQHLSYPVSSLCLLRAVFRGGGGGGGGGGALMCLTC